jgi:hypothetical protein
LVPWDVRPLRLHALDFSSLVRHWKTYGGYQVKLERGQFVCYSCISKFERSVS